MFRSRLPKLIFYHIVIHFRNNFSTICIKVFLHSSEIIPPSKLYIIDVGENKAERK